MDKYEVRDVVCDYGVFENGELKLILNSKRIALQIVHLLEEDERTHRELNPIKDYPPYLDRMNVIDSILFRAWQMGWLDRLEQFNRQKAEIEDLKVENDSLRSAGNSLKMHLKKAEAEIKRLQSENKILSQNADEAFQEGLNENRNLFTEEILKEFAKFLIDRSEGG